MAEVEEFEAFLEPTFDAVSFASSLLQATNVADHAELDVHTALKKLRFDAAECDKRISALTSANHSDLLHNVFSVSSVHDSLVSTLEPSNKRLQLSYKRIDHEVVAPYDAAVRLNGAFQRIHHTLQLLRGCSFFVLFVQQLNQVSKDEGSGDGEASVGGSSGGGSGGGGVSGGGGGVSGGGGGSGGGSGDDSMVRTARIYKQLLSFYSPEDLNKYSSDFSFEASVTPVVADLGGHELVAMLRAVSLVQDYKPLLVSKYSAFHNHLSSAISHDLGHHNSFVGSNVALQRNLAAFHLLEPRAFLALMESAAMAKSIQVSLTALTRALQSPRTLVSTLNDVASASSSFVSNMTSVLSISELSGAAPRTLLQVLESSLGSSLEDAFYDRLASKFKKALAVTLARGGPIARNIRAQSTAISDAVSGLNGAAAVHFRDAFSVIPT